MYKLQAKKRQKSGTELGSPACLVMIQKEGSKISVYSIRTTNNKAKAELHNDTSKNAKESAHTKGTKKPPLNYELVKCTSCRLKRDKKAEQN